MGDWGGTVPSFTAGQVLTAADLDTIADILTALTGDWSPWTPSLTNLTAGSAPVVARYRRIGHTVDWYFRFVFSSGAAVGSNPQFTLPYPPASFYPTGAEFPGWARLLGAGTAPRVGELIYISGSTVQVNYWSSSTATAGITSTAPWTWNTNDTISAGGTYCMA